MAPGDGAKEASGEHTLRGCIPGTGPKSRNVKPHEHTSAATAPAPGRRLRGQAAARTGPGKRQRGSGRKIDGERPRGRNAQLPGPRALARAVEGAWHAGARLPLQYIVSQT